MSRCSFRIAKQSFAAEAATLTNISDEDIRSWKLSSEFPGKNEVVQKIFNLLNKCQTTIGSQNKIVIAYETFTMLVANLSWFAYHQLFMETLSQKSEELMKECHVKLYNPLYPQEECLRFARLYEFLKAFKPLVDRVMKIHHPSLVDSTPQCVKNCINPDAKVLETQLLGTETRRYPLRSNRGKGKVGM